MKVSRPVWEAVGGDGSPLRETALPIDFTIEFQASQKLRFKKFKKYRITGYEIIIINCSKIPSGINEIHKYLKRYIVMD